MADIYRCTIRVHSLHEFTAPLRVGSGNTCICIDLLMLWGPAGTCLYLPLLSTQDHAREAAEIGCSTEPITIPTTTVPCFGLATAHNVSEQFHAVIVPASETLLVSLDILGQIHKLCVFRDGHKCIPGESSLCFFHHVHFVLTAQLT